MPLGNLEFTPETAREFRATYKQAVLDSQETFVFQGREVLTVYAKYVCEYLVMRGLLPVGQVSQP